MKTFRPRTCYRAIFLSILAFFTFCSPKAEKDSPLKTAATTAKTLRFATYNCWLFRPGPGQLLSQLTADTVEQIQKVAEVIQRNAPDVLALLELDYDATGRSLQLFQEQYLAKSHNGSQPVHYPYAMAFPSNTGVLTGMDLNGNGSTEDPEDAYGYGTHPGQYGFAILSKYPIDTARIRSFQHFLWKDMPNASVPRDPQTQAGYYAPAAWEKLRLSSKNHVDVPILVNGQTVHALLMHPTPPVFDGPADHNGKRNHDEIRLFADYISNADYLVDDQQNTGGLGKNEKFVVMGDLNADPNDGDSAAGAIMQLLQHPRVHQAVALGDLIPASEGGREHTKGKPKLMQQNGKPEHDTSFYGLRIDYVLPSANLEVTATGVFWPPTSDPLHY